MTFKDIWDKLGYDQKKQVADALDGICKYHMGRNCKIGGGWCRGRCEDFKLMSSTDALVKEMKRKQKERKKEKNDEKCYGLFQMLRGAQIVRDNMDKNGLVNMSMVEKKLKSEGISSIPYQH